MLGGFEGSVDAWAVEADDDGTVDVEYWDAHLAGFVDRLVEVLGVMLDIAVVVLDAKLVEVVFGGVTECAPTSAVDDNFLIHNRSIAQGYYTL